MEDQGIQIVVAQADVSDPAQMAMLFERLEDSGFTLRGIIHAAGIVEDHMIANMDWPAFARVLQAKVQGAWNLHKLASHSNLDFFVFFSSTASLFGSAGQANHAAANAFMDSLAAARKLMGLPAVSINWGAWAEIGSVARMGLEGQVKARGMEPIAAKQGLEMLGKLLNHSASHVGVAQMDWPRFLSGVAGFPFFDEVTKRHERAHFKETTVRSHGFIERLRLAPAGKQSNMLIEFLRDEIARVLGLTDPQEIQLRHRLFALGIDSLTAIELKTRIESALCSTLPATFIFDFPTIEAIGNYLHERLFTKAETTDARWPGQIEVSRSDGRNEDVDELLSDISQMSESEIRRRLSERNHS